MSPTLSDMAKLEKILMLLNLLGSRQHVSGAEIRKVCGISRRSLFRYITAISEAGTPVFYDRTLRGYRLNNRNHMKLGAIRPHETILVLVALRNLSARVNREYQTDVYQLCQNLMSHQALFLGDLDAFLESRLSLSGEVGDLSELITVLNIQVGIQNRRPIVVSKDNSTVPSLIDIAKPALLFAGNWQLKDLSSLCGASVALTEITRVAVK